MRYPLCCMVMCVQSARRGYVRNLGLSANQVLHIPGAGDFQIRQMRVLDKPAHLGSTRKARASQSSDNGNSASAMEVSVAEQAFIVPDPQQQEQLLGRMRLTSSWASRPGPLTRYSQFSCSALGAGSCATGRADHFYAQDYRTKR